MGLDTTKPVFGVSNKVILKTSLLSYRDKLDYWNFAWSKFGYNNFQYTNNKGADQSVWMGMLVCAFVVHKPPDDRFSRVKDHMFSKLLSVISLACKTVWIMIRDNIFELLIRHKYTSEIAISI